MRHRSWQPLRIMHDMPMRQDRADQHRVFVREKGIQRLHRGQATIDRGGLETVFGLLYYEVVNIVEGDRGGWLIAHHFDELFEVVPVIAPGTRLGVAAAQPIDEAVNFD